MAKENPLSGRKPVHRWVAAATRLLPSGLLAGGAAPRPSGAAMSVVVGPGRKVTSVLSELLEAIPKGGDAVSCAVYHRTLSHPPAKC